MNNRGRDNRVTATLDEESIKALREIANKEPKRSMSAVAAELILNSLAKNKMLENEDYLL